MSDELRGADRFAVVQIAIYLAGVYRVLDAYKARPLPPESVFQTARFVGQAEGALTCTLLPPDVHARAKALIAFAEGLVREAVGIRPAMTEEEVDALLKRLDDHYAAHPRPTRSPRKKLRGRAPDGAP